LNPVTGLVETILTDFSAWDDFDPSEWEWTFEKDMSILGTYN